MVVDSEKQNTCVVWKYSRIKVLAVQSLHTRSIIYALHAAHTTLLDEFGGAHVMVEMAMHTLAGRVCTPLLCRIT